jgi:hypothetical protein
MIGAKRAVSRTVRGSYQTAVQAIASRWERPFSVPSGEPD